MENETQISKALQLKSRMQSLINQGYALMSEMASPQSAAYATTMALVWSPEALQEMPTSLGIVSQALADIQAQCPNLAGIIFPQEPTQEAIDAS